jgi:lipid A 3-O-deacylase PagL
MKTLRLGKTRFALATFVRNLRTINISLALLSVSLAVFLPMAHAQGERQGSTSSTADSKEAILDARDSVLPDQPREPVVNSIVEKHPRPVPPDFNRNIYFRNKLEFSFDLGWLPVNIPFPFDVLEGDPYDLYPLRYTLVPVMASVRWHVGGPSGPPVLRGNWDVTFSLSATAIPRGPETHYFSYNMGLRRNFIPRNWRVTPYWDVRAGVGYINAKGPLGVYYAQGQNFTFNINMGAGARYNLNPRYGVSAGLNWMHISNGNLSSPAYSNYGINVYGPMLGLDIQLRPHSRRSE